MIFPSQSQCLERLWTCWNMKSDMDGRQSLCAMDFLWSCSPLLDRSTALKCVIGFLMFLCCFFSIQANCFWADGHISDCESYDGEWTITKHLSDDKLIQLLSSNPFIPQGGSLRFKFEFFLDSCLHCQSPELQVTIIFISKFVSNS